MLSEDKKKDIKETVKLLVNLDEHGLTIIKSNTEVLAAVQRLRNKDNDKDKQPA